MDPSTAAEPSAHGRWPTAEKLPTRPRCRNYIHRAGRPRPMRGRCGYARLMAELDYAFLADYAVVENGRLTAVGASFTHLQVPSLPFQKSLSAALRVRVPAAASTFDLKIELRAPENAWVLGADLPVDVS